MGKPMELMVPVNDDINIYDGNQIEGSSEAKSRNTWVEMFDMIVTEQGFEKTGQ